MNATVTISPGELDKLGNELFLIGQELLLPVQEAMAAEFQRIVLNNFGEAGEDRPEEWVALSPGYAKRVGRPHATLVLTPAEARRVGGVPGLLRDSIEKDVSPERGQVGVTGVPYAAVHQWGGGNNIPARPYFPIYADGTATAYTTEKVTEAAMEALREAL